jgi:hypothetical protein
MTPLRQPMTEDMQLRGLAPATQQAYLRYVEQLAVFTGKSPDLATDEDFRQFFLALHKQRGLSRSSATLAIAGFKFLFENTLQRPWPRLDLFRPRPTQTLPIVREGKLFTLFMLYDTFRIIFRKFGYKLGYMKRLWADLRDRPRDVLRLSDAGAGDGTRTRTGLPPTVFKNVASAISPLRPGVALL